jgi:uncharacterized membrane protein HdeD (DUF308 family)
MSEPTPEGLQANSAGRRWNTSSFALGMTFLCAGLFVLLDISLVAAISSILIGTIAAVVGIAEIVHGMFSPTWRNSIGRVLGGILYVTFGVLLVFHAEFSVIFLTLALGSALLVSGIVRLVIGARAGAGYRWLLVSGLVGTAAGLGILFVGSDDRTRFIALLFGVDLLVHGIGWLVAARRDCQTIA